MELVISNVSKQYKEVKALDNVSLTLTPGVWGLLGANGAGKTTLIKTICTLIKSCSGQILWEGKNVSFCNEEYLSKISYLPQHFGSDSQFTVADYLEYMSALKGLKKEEYMPKIQKLLAEVSLSENINMKMKNLSGGMLRRLGIAQALLNEPSVLVLDEPTVGLDPKERVHFRKILSEYAGNKITLLSTHIVSDVESLANFILIMHKGKIIMTGTPKELCSKIQNMVWEHEIEKKKIQSFDKMCVVNMKNTENDMVLVRYVADQPITPNLTPMPPTLEDVYMWSHIRGIKK